MLNKPAVMLQGVLRVRTAGFGGSWVPVFVSAQQRKNSETYWPVSLTLSTLNCIVCKSNQPEPQVSQGLVCTQCIGSVCCSSSWYV